MRRHAARERRMPCLASGAFARSAACRRPSAEARLALPVAGAQWRTPALRASVRPAPRCELVAKQRQDVDGPVRCRCGLVDPDAQTARSPSLHMPPARARSAAPSPADRVSRRSQDTAVSVDRGADAGWLGAQREIRPGSRRLGTSARPCPWTDPPGPSDRLHRAVIDVDSAVAGSLTLLRRRPPHPHHRPRRQTNRVAHRSHARIRPAATRRPQGATGRARQPSLPTSA